MPLTQDREEVKLVAEARAKCKGTARRRTHSAVVRGDAPDSKKPNLALLFVVMGATSSLAGDLGR